MAIESLKMIIMKYFSLLVFIVIGLSLHCQEEIQCEWELSKDESGIKIYTCKPEGSSFKAFNLETEIEAGNISVIASAILNVKNYKAWMPDTEEAVLIKQFDDSHDIHYIRTAAPWPVNDRDGVYEQKATWFKDENRVVIELWALEDFDYPQENKVTRMTKGSGFWEITEINKEIFKLTYQYHPDPGGSIPAWLANTSVVNIPFDMTRNLKEIIADGDYDDAKLDFILE
jgi:hypothetical protein